MTILCQGCKAEPRIPFWCENCEEVLCSSCLKDHSEHEKGLKFLCQECEEEPGDSSTLFCEECEQHLCGSCDERIHNKGKRAKHVREKTNW